GKPGVIVRAVIGGDVREAPAHAVTCRIGIRMILVGRVFVACHVGLVSTFAGDNLDTTFWIIVVFLYYILATLLPIDKIIGKIYPLFAIALLFMAVGILFMLYYHHPVLPEFWDGLSNTHPQSESLPIFPIM